MYSRSLLLVCCVTLPVFAEAPLRSGPQIGDELTGELQPLNVTGKYAGVKACLYCEYGEGPVVLIFARKPTPELTTLIEKLDALPTKGQTKLGCFVIFCSEDKTLTKQLQNLAKAKKLRRVVLTLDSPKGPEGFDIAKNADVTTIGYLDFVVQTNYAFRQKELDAKAIDRVVGDVQKMLGAK